MTLTRRFLPPMSTLCAFEAAARLQNFTAAAAELHLTQSAVSRQIRQLEELLGAELFTRQRQTVQLNFAGQTYAREIRDALHKVSNATLGFRANPGGGTLNLGVLPTFGTRWLAPRLPDFFDRHPGIALHLTTRLEPFDFQCDSIDAAVHFGSPFWSGAELDLLFGECVVPMCSPTLLARYRFSTPLDLLQAPLLHLRSRPDAWERWFHAMGVPPIEVHGMLVDQFAFAAQGAVSGLGIALLPRFLFQQDIERGDLVLALDAAVPSESAYYLAWPTDRSEYAPLMAFREWLTSVARSEASAPHSAKAAAPEAPRA